MQVEPTITVNAHRHLLFKMLPWRNWNVAGVVTPWTHQTALPLPSKTRPLSTLCTHTHTRPWFQSPALPCKWRVACTTYEGSMAPAAHTLFSPLCSPADYHPRLRTERPHPSISMNLDIVIRRQGRTYRLSMKIMTERSTTLIYHNNMVIVFFLKGTSEWCKLHLKFHARSRAHIDTWDSLRFPFSTSRRVK